VSSSWKNETGQLQFDVEVPVNTKAAIYIPADNAAAIKESGVELSKNNNIRVVGNEGNYIKVETGSGKYHFTIKK
ncbi:MAG: alpha-L-rhamnosidase C-terminal domain-containing protein, partial [Bacteroidota bacterium]|nr:alpha-L-rhamnosidase C-terminal domain-containing protein [Bacteroidota bacterium]